MNGIYFISCIIITICVLCKFTDATTLHKFKDSKISHIKPAPEHINDDNNINSLLNHHQATDKQSLKNSHHHHHHYHHSKATNLDNKKLLSNHDLLKSLGLTKLTIPPSHHRKRLAVESRHHARPDDSHMFIIKLPPNPVYYTNTKSAHDKNSIEDKNKKVSVDFKSNGKPGRIYHWNLPVLKKMFTGTEGRNANSRDSNDIADLIDIKHIPTWSKPWENETIEKSYRKVDREQEKNYKTISPSYYAPKTAVRPKKSSSSSSSSRKYFPGNGKPQGFYVMSKSEKPLYQKLIP